MVTKSGLLFFKAVQGTTNTRDCPTVTKGVSGAYADEVTPGNTLTLLCFHQTRCPVMSIYDPQNV